MIFNETDFFGVLMINLTNNVTGDIFLTSFILMILIMFFFLALRLPVELSAILIVPMLIVFMGWGGGDWKPIAGLIVLYLSIMFGRFFMR